ncbi:hypothetical protein BSNK01_02200 [Bacillaceae bacterium]
MKSRKYVPLIVIPLLFCVGLSACSPGEPPAGDVDIRGYDVNEEDGVANEEDVDLEGDDLLPRPEERQDVNPWRDRDLDERLIDDDLEDLDRRDVSGRNDPGNNDDDSDIFDSDRGGGLRE